MGAKAQEHGLHGWPDYHVMGPDGWCGAVDFGLTNDQMIEYEMLAECRAFLEYYRGVLYEGTMAEWWASFCVEEAVDTGRGFLAASCVEITT